MVIEKMLMGSMVENIRASGRKSLYKGQSNYKRSLEYRWNYAISNGIIFMTVYNYYLKLVIGIFT